MQEPQGRSSLEITDTVDKRITAKARRLPLRMLYNGAHPTRATFPPGQIAGRLSFRSDTKCWYYDDGANWNVVGIEQTGTVGAGPVQTVTTTIADVGGSSVSITTLGAARISAVGHYWSDTNNGALQVFFSINGANVMADAYNSVAGTNSMVVDGSATVAAAGTYTVKLRAVMATGTSARLVNFSYAWRVEKA